MKTYPGFKGHITEDIAEFAHTSKRSIENNGSCVQLFVYIVDIGRTAIRRRRAGTGPTSIRQTARTREVVIPRPHDAGTIFDRGVSRGEDPSRRHRYPSRLPLILCPHTRIDSGSRRHISGGRCWRIARQGITIAVRINWTSPIRVVGVAARPSGCGKKRISTNRKCSNS